ncbi:iron-sulfur cluster carrier protein ApbC [Stenoxybacter acetivorans]|uniref:iron-sulfur cluster carrier protein ApbC n=1 Tax=Stenoxybacter acetivorans TaxID=422441 RepID=UPI0005628C01|nr:iron-sulfur cluster carrier protein ApbC [Stenoxybacter acetivorans]
MDLNLLRTLLSNLSVPNSRRTIGSDKAIADIRHENNHVYVDLRFPYPILHLANILKEAIQAALIPHIGGNSLHLQLDSRIETHKVQQGVATISGVKNIIAVGSGKGGVGKSTVSANLAVALQRMGARVGVLDADIYGPSQPTLFGVAANRPTQENGKLIPIATENGIQVMSIGFLVNTDQAMIWRGPMVSQALQQLLFQSQWDNVDYLIIDLPPGTGDIQLTLSQKIPVTGAVVVTTPQDLALIDARKAIDMFNKVNIPIFGVLENMSTHICSQCGHIEPIFGEGGGKRLSEKLNVPLLGQLPLTLAVREAMDAGEAVALQQNNAAVAQAFEDAAWILVQTIADKSKDFSKHFSKIVVE